MSAVEVKNLNFSYNKNQPLLEDVSFEIKKGEFVTILGHNGSGKSTLAKLMIGLLEPIKGSIKIDGMELNEENVYKIREKVGIVFQNPDNQFVGVTVMDDIAFGLENRNINPEVMRQEVIKYAKIVGMEDYLDRNPDQLSGGQKQRVAIASVLAFKPEILIFDEATSMLDPIGVNEVMETIKKLMGTITIISITHNMSEVKNASKVIVLNEGKVALCDTPINAFKNKELMNELSLDITKSMLLRDLIVNSKDINDEMKKRLEETLWEFAFKK